MNDCNPECPSVRATIRDGRITLNPWNPRLLSYGPAAMVFDALAQEGTTLLDLSVDRVDADEPNELIVRTLTPTLPSGARATLLDWARSVGYRRVWLDDEVVSFDIADAPAGWASVTCRTCGAYRRERTTGFLAPLHRHGWFPGFCEVCGDSLPEWTFTTTTADATSCD